MVFVRFYLIKFGCDRYKTVTIFEHAYPSWQRASVGPPPNEYGGRPLLAFTTDRGNFSDQALVKDIPKEKN